MNRTACSFLAGMSLLISTLAEDAPPRAAKTSVPHEPVPAGSKDAPSQPATAPAAPRDDAARKAAAMERGKAREKERKEQFVKEEEKRREAAYGPVLSEIGLSLEQMAHVSRRLTELHREAIVAGDAMGHLLQERSKYDKEMKALMGDAGYRKYRAFEDAKPFRREVEHLKEAAAEKKVEIAPEQEKELVRLFQQVNLSTMESWDGPYDVRPSPIVGTEPVLANMRAKFTSVSEAFATLQRTHEWSALQQEVKDVTAAYFMEKIQGMQDSINHLSLPEEERMKLAREKAEAQIRAIGGRAK